MRSLTFCTILWASEDFFAVTVVLSIIVLGSRGDAFKSYRDKGATAGVGRL